MVSRWSSYSAAGTEEEAGACQVDLIVAIARKAPECPSPSRQLRPNSPIGVPVPPLHFALCPSLSAHVLMIQSLTTDAFMITCFSRTQGGCLLGEWPSPCKS
jgi:hypothetical protein